MKQKKITHYLFIVAVIIVLNFFIPRMLPGSPISTLVGEDVGQMTAAEKMGILDAYHLNEPMYVQFWYYIKDLFTLNWGNSFSMRQPIFSLLWSRIGWTLLLVGLNLLLSTVIGTALGIFSAYRRKNKKDIGIVLGTTVISSIPPFWIGMILISIFGVKLGWFPIYGAYSMWENLSGWSRFIDVLHHLALPLITMVITSLMIYFTTARYSTLQVIGEDYVKLAKMRGVPKKKITFNYVIRNMLLPVFTTFMMDIGYILSGSVVIESVFSYPGLGTLMHEAVNARDYPLIQYSFLVTSLITVLALFISDCMYGILDPRMRDESDG